MGRQLVSAKRCLQDEELLSYLEGRLEKEERKAAKSHLLRCGECRAGLALCVRLLQPEISPEEQAQLDRLGLAHLAQRARALYRVRAAQAQSVPTPSSKGVFVSWRLAASLIAVPVLVAGIVFLVNDQPSSGLEQGRRALMRLFAHGRPLEPRLTGGFSYAPFERQRGQSLDAISQTWLTFAREKLNEVARKEGTAGANHALGQLKLIEQKLNEALERLQQALRDKPDDPWLYSDIGVVYMQKGGINRSMADFEQAALYFTRALNKDPRLPEALFNRALCYQKMALFSSARADWRQYLALDPASNWAQEARRNLELIQGKQ